MGNVESCGPGPSKDEVMPRRANSSAAKFGELTQNDSKVLRWIQQKKKEKCACSESGRNP